ncbi:MAG TPA: FAD-dependent oxidoreductase [Candidatus Saccharimonadales bacterium]|nr:FAD-dependent oxidoreductase [Candidatus Saccharimonadales bacterium]
MPPSALTLPFLKSEKLSKDAYAFTFDRTSAREWNFSPGQYIRMTLPVENPDERGTTRLFSLVSSPLQKDHIMITTRVIQSSFKKKLLTLKPGEQVQFFGPMGVFTFRENDPGSHVFLAGGIGITPFHSMLLYANAKKLSVPITFFASFSTTDDMVFYEEFSNIAKENPSIKVVYTVTQPEKSGKPWSGETGRISAEMIKKYVKDFDKALYYVAGPQVMVEAMVKMVSEMGLPTERILRENFTGY